MQPIQFTQPGTFVPQTPDDTASGVAIIEAFIDGMKNKNTKMMHGASRPVLMHLFKNCADMTLIEDTMAQDAFFGRDLTKIARQEALKRLRRVIDGCGTRYACAMMFDSHASHFTAICFDIEKQRCTVMESLKRKVHDKKAIEKELKILDNDWTVVQETKFCIFQRESWECGYMGIFNILMWFQKRQQANKKCNPSVLKNVVANLMEFGMTDPKEKIATAADANALRESVLQCLEKEKNRVFDENTTATCRTLTFDPESDSDGNGSLSSEDEDGIGDSEPYHDFSRDPKRIALWKTFAEGEKHRLNDIAEKMHFSSSQFWKLAAVEARKDLLEWLETNMNKDLRAVVVLSKRTLECIDRFMSYTDAQRDKVFENGAVKHVFESKNDAKFIRLLQLESALLEAFLALDRDTQNEYFGYSRQEFVLLCQKLLGDRSSTDCQPYAADFSVHDGKQWLDLKEWTAEVVTGVVDGYLNHCCYEARDVGWWGAYDTDVHDYVENMILPELRRRPKLVLERSLVFNPVQFQLQLWRLMNDMMDSAKTRLFLVEGMVQIGKTGVKLHIQLAMHMLRVSILAKMVVCSDKVLSAVGLIGALRQSADEVLMDPTEKEEAVRIIDECEQLMKQIEEEEDVHIKQNLKNIHDIKHNDNKRLIEKFEAHPSADKVFGMTRVVDGMHRDHATGKNMTSAQRRSQAEKTAGATVVVAANAHAQWANAFEVTQNADLLMVVLDECDAFVTHRTAVGSDPNEHERGTESTNFDKCFVGQMEVDDESSDEEDDDANDIDDATPQLNEAVLQEGIENEFSEKQKRCVFMISGSLFTQIMDLSKRKDSFDNYLSDRITPQSFLQLRGRSGEFEANWGGKQHRVQYKSNYVSLKNYNSWHDSNGNQQFLPDGISKTALFSNPLYLSFFLDSLKKDKHGQTRASCFLSCGNAGVTAANGIEDQSGLMRSYAQQQSLKDIQIVVPIFLIISGSKFEIWLPKKSKKILAKPSKTHDGPAVIDDGKFVYRASSNRAVPGDVLGALHSLSDDFCRVHGINNHYPITILAHSQAKRSVVYNGAWGGITHIALCPLLKAVMSDWLQLLRSHSQAGRAMRKNGWVGEDGEPVVRILTSKKLWDMLRMYEELPSTVCNDLLDPTKDTNLTSCVADYLKQKNVSTIEECDDIVKLFGSSHPLFTKKTGMNVSVAPAVIDQVAVKRRVIEANQPTAFPSPPSKKQKAILDNDTRILPRGLLVSDSLLKQFEETEELMPFAMKPVSHVLLAVLCWLQPYFTDGICTFHQFRSLWEEHESVILSALEAHCSSHNRHDEYVKWKHGTSSVTVRKPIPLYKDATSLPHHFLALENNGYLIVHHQGLFSSSKQWKFGIEFLP